MPIPGFLRASSRGVPNQCGAMGHTAAWPQPPTHNPQERCSFYDLELHISRYRTVPIFSHSQRTPEEGFQPRSKQLALPLKHVLTVHLEKPAPETRPVQLRSWILSSTQLQQIST